MTVNEALNFATAHLSERHVPHPRQDAELILTSVLERNRAFLYSHPEHELLPGEESLFHQWLAKRGEHYPLQYLRGTQEFYGREFIVGPGVFIPRPETELLVEVSLDFLKTRSEPKIRAADVGTGCGCIAITLACEEKRAQVTATDISDIALDTARRNAEQHRCLDQVQFCRGAILEPLRDHSERFDVIISNPPYVSNSQRDQVERSVRQYEPSQAVFAGRSGLEIYTELFRQAKKRLRPQGRLVIELGNQDAQRVLASARQDGWVLRELRKDLADIERCAVLEKTD